MIILKRLLIVISVLSISIQGFSQGSSGSLKGTLKNSTTGEPIPFANVIIEKGGSMVTGAKTDFDGAYNLKAIPVGTYDLTASCVGFTSKKMTGISIGSGIKIINLQLDKGIALKEVQVIAYEKELIDPEGGSSQKITGDELKKMPGRGVQAAATIAGGVVSTDGQIESIRGARSSSTIYYIDGVKVIGSLSLPQSAIEQIEVILGGLPPMYGDATGGIISVTTKGASNRFFGGVEAYTRVVANNYFDIGGENMLGFNLGGPLIKLKDKGKIAAARAKGAAEDTVIKKPFISYFISGQYEINPNGSNPVFPNYRFKQNIIDSVAATPMVYRSGSRAEPLVLFLSPTDLTPVYKTKNFSTNVNLAGKLDVNTSAKTTLTFGGSILYYKSHGGSETGLNVGMPVGENWGGTMRVHGRFTHRLSPDSAKLAAKPDSVRMFKNVTYSLMADYTRSSGGNWSEKHKDNFFDYGYVGSFKTHRTPTYEYRTETFANPDPNSEVDSITLYAQYLNAYKDTLYEYTPGTINPELAVYTSQFYDQAGDNVVGNYDNMLNAQEGGALLNGDGPSGAHGYSWGGVAGGYGFSNSNQARVTGAISVDIGKSVSKAHEVSVGFEHEKRSSKGYWLSVHDLWYRMRELANFHIQQLDINNPIFVYDTDANGDFVLDEEGNKIFSGKVDLNRIYDAETQNFFDYNLRNKLGLGSLDMLNTDEYDPSVYSIDMFSADELINDGNSYVGYNGYDHLGNKLTSNPTIDDYYVKKDDFGNYLREIPRSQPIYSAAYIQDRFAFRDLFFTAGIRIDRFDNNRPVLKDKYSLFNVKEVQDLEDDEFGAKIPENIGDDYKVYVNDYKNPGQITGYRDGSTWYNSVGTEVNSPVSIESGTGINPYFVENDSIISKNLINSSAFKDYVPDVNVSPRLSFSFPISDEALFFAHYDILVQRPRGNNGFPYQGYLYLRNDAGPRLGNPDLKSEKTIDYELGFQQKLSNKSAIKFTAFYREMRDQLQAIVVSGAFPNKYYSTGNIDFSTVKGGTVGFDLRKIGQSGISGQLNYTLQFADGTGSSSGDGMQYLQGGFENLRILIPLNFDRRHSISLRMDYRTDVSKDYKGWVIGGPKGDEKEGKGKGFQVFANSGVNVKIVGGSGMPYSKSTKAVNGTLKGAPNGARLPWSATFDVTFSREFEFALGAREEGHKKGEKDGKTIYGYAYLEVFNIMNFRFARSVNAFTGVTNNDGYLSTPEAQLALANSVNPANELSWREHSLARMGNYFSPRLMYLGVTFSF